MNYLRFDYTNWRGDHHNYVIMPDTVNAAVSGALTYRRPNADDTDEAWMLHGMIITRDGDKREELVGANRRRSFKLCDIRNLEEVPA
jgi:hypothetical protein